MRDTQRDTSAGSSSDHDQAKARYRGSLAVELRMRGLKYGERADVAVDAYRVDRYLQAEATHARSWPPALAGDPRALARCLRAMDERSDLVELADACALLDERNPRPVAQERCNR